MAAMVGGRAGGGRAKPVTIGEIHIDPVERDPLLEKGDGGPLDIGAEGMADECQTAHRTSPVW
jgi:hypothetical protein